MYEVRYGTPNNYKIVDTSSLIQAERIYSKTVKFAVKHELKWSISMFDGGWRVKYTRT